jgi:hypothetical protein
MKLKYFIPIWGFYLIIKEHPYGTDELWGIGLPLFHGAIGGLLLGLLITIIFFTA